MFEIILKKLTVWRNETAQKEGVELFRVLPNKTLEEIARKCPKNKQEMIEIKGIKEKKFNRYGKDIIKIIEGNGDSGHKAYDPATANNDPAYFKKKMIKERQEEKIFSVGEFWDLLNEKLWTFQTKIRGEVSNVDLRNNVIYFSLKDKKDDSIMNCFIFRYQYQVLGIELAEGMEILVQGYPEIYKPYGRLSLRTNVIELEGEGALKKEYEILKQKLEAEGLFDAQNKKTLHALPQNIGLITSKDGAAIGDFISNIGKYGLSIKFLNSSVEGKRAVFELINAIRTFKKMPELDAVVIIRGGGSLESLQAFNNETLIREMKLLKVPVICGVGHDRDISLLSLAADYSVSTPTAAARMIGESWEREIIKFGYLEKNILSGFERKLDKKKYKLDSCYKQLERGFDAIIKQTEDIHYDFLHGKIKKLEENIMLGKIHFNNIWHDTCGKFENNVSSADNSICRIENMVKLNNPERQLKMGYGIISRNKKGIRSIDELWTNDIVKIRLIDGEADTKILETKKFKK